LWGDVFAQPVVEHIGGPSGTDSARTAFYARRAGRSRASFFRQNDYPPNIHDPGRRFTPVSPKPSRMSEIDGELKAGTDKILTMIRSLSQ